MRHKHQTQASAWEPVADPSKAGHESKHCGRNRDLRRRYVRGATVQAFRLGHDHTPHLGYRISTCGKTFVHLGDADVSNASFASLMQRGSVDVAMVPFWWFLESSSTEFISQRWKPRRAMAFQLGKGDGGYAERLRKKFPQVWICTKEGEAREF